jgi:hypothetical protein
MAFVLKFIASTTLASYSNAPIQADWVQFKTEVIKSHMDGRVSRSLQIIDRKQKKCVAAAKPELLSRFCSVESERRLSLFSLNFQMRRLERRFFEFVLLSKKVEYQFALLDLLPSFAGRFPAPAIACALPVAISCACSRLSRENA